MRIVIDNRHMDYSGGGEHVRMIISLLSNFGDIYVIKNPNFYSGNNFSSTNINTTPKRYNYNFIPDLFVYIDYRGHVSPIGRVNAQICFYGIDKKVSNYDYALCINDFVARSVSKNWANVCPIVIPPYYDHTLYRIGVKEKRLINIGNFFIESDGHSKNQHLLIDWFLGSGLSEDGWVFDFFGFKNNDDYFNSLIRKVGKCNSINLYPNAAREDMLSSLSSSRFLIHAMGLGRTKPEQTEHFGLVAVESLLSGCRPIVHLSGGCPEIKGTLHYSELNQIRSLIDSDCAPPEEIRDFGLLFSYQNSILAASKFIEQIKLDLIFKSKNKFLFKDFYSLLKYFLIKK